MIQSFKNVREKLKQKKFINKCCHYFKPIAIQFEIDDLQYWYNQKLNGNTVYRKSLGEEHLRDYKLNIMHALVWLTYRIQHNDEPESRIPPELNKRALSYTNINDYVTSISDIFGIDDEIIRYKIILKFFTDINKEMNKDPWNKSPLVILKNMSPSTIK